MYVMDMARLISYKSLFLVFASYTDVDLWKVPKIFRFETTLASGVSVLLPYLYSHTRLFDRVIFVSCLCMFCHLFELQPSARVDVSMETAQRLMFALAMLDGVETHAAKVMQTSSCLISASFINFMSELSVLLDTSN